MRARAVAPALLLALSAAAAAPREHPGRLVQAGSLRLFVETEGGGPPLFVLPAGPGLDHAYFHPYLTSLSEQSTVVYLDPGGCGRSDPRPEGDYSLETMVEEVEGVRAALGLQTIDLLGHGLGQAVAVLYADRHPARVGRMIFLGASMRARGFLGAPGLKEAMSPQMRDALAEAKENRYLSADGRYREELRILAPLMFFRLTDRSFHNAFAERVTTAAAVREALETRLAAGAPGADLKAPLGRLKAPVLVVAGRHDRAATVAEAETVRDAVPGARLRILEESGSFAFAEQPVDFTKEVRNFLSGAGGGI